jgi:hypothetical protein
MISQMCGRSRLSRRKQIIEEHVDAVSGEEDRSPRYNVAPTQPIPVVPELERADPGTLVDALWIDSFVGRRTASVAASMINAIAETAATKPAFRDALKFRSPRRPRLNESNGLVTTGYPFLFLPSQRCVIVRPVVQDSSL